MWLVFVRKAFNSVKIFHITNNKLIRLNNSYTVVLKYCVVNYVFGICARISFVSVALYFDRVNLETKPIPGASGNRV